MADYNAIARQHNWGDPQQRAALQKQYDMQEAEKLAIKARQTAINDRGLTPEQAAVARQWFENNWTTILGAALTVVTGGLSGGLTGLINAGIEVAKDVTKSVAGNYIKGAVGDAFQRRLGETTTPQQLAQEIFPNHTFNTYNPGMTSGPPPRP